MKSGLLLDVVVAQSTSILELLSSEDKTLLVWWNALLVLDLALHIVDGVAGLNLEGDGLARYLRLSVCFQSGGGARKLNVDLGFSQDGRLTGLNEDLHDCL